MNCTTVPSSLEVLRAPNGDPLLMFGEAGGDFFLWPTTHIRRHRIAFARWSRRNVHRFRGRRLVMQHPMCESVRRWAEWLGAKVSVDGSLVEI